MGDDLKDDGSCRKCDKTHTIVVFSQLGTPIPLCDTHMEERQKEDDRLARLYGVGSDCGPPADFDPAYAGEAWDEY